MKIVIIYSTNINLYDSLSSAEHKRWYSEQCSCCSFPFNKMYSAAVQRCTVISTFCYFQKYDTEVYQMCTIALHDKQNKMYITAEGKLTQIAELRFNLIYSFMTFCAWHDSKRIFFLIWIKKKDLYIIIEDILSQNRQLAVLLWCFHY